MKLETLLVPFDFGEPSESALAYAVDLAERLGARVLVVHAFALPIVGLPDGVLVASATYAGRLIEVAQKTLSEAVAKYRGRRAPVEGALEQGEPEEVIFRLIGERNVDLVVMGTHGRRGVPRLLVGSVAERIVRESPVPVVTVHAGTVQEEPVRAPAVIAARPL